MQWLRDNLGLIGESAEVETLAGSVDDNGGIYFVPAFSGLYAPYWKDGRPGGYRRDDPLREQGAYRPRRPGSHGLSDPRSAGGDEERLGVRLSALRVDGGMVRNELLMQFQADILRVPVTRPRISETTALGAAYAAGLAVGFWTNLEELRLGTGRPIKPGGPGWGRKSAIGYIAAGRRLSPAPLIGSINSLRKWITD